MFDHFGALLDAYDHPVRSDLILKQFETQAGAATDIQHGLAAGQAEARNGALPHRLEGRQLKVVYPGTAPILIQCDAAIVLTA